MPYCSIKIFCVVVVSIVFCLSKLVMDINSFSLLKAFVTSLFVLLYSFRFSSVGLLRRFIFALFLISICSSHVLLNQGFPLRPLLLKPMTSSAVSLIIFLILSHSSFILDSSFCVSSSLRT